MIPFFDIVVAILLVSFQVFSWITIVHVASTADEQSRSQFFGRWPTWTLLKAAISLSVQLLLAFALIWVEMDFQLRWALAIIFGLLALASFILTLARVARMTEIEFGLVKASGANIQADIYLGFFLGMLLPGYLFATSYYLSITPQESREELEGRNELIEIPDWSAFDEETIRQMAFEADVGSIVSFSGYIYQKGRDGSWNLLQ